MSGDKLEFLKDASFDETDGSDVLHISPEHPKSHHNTSSDRHVAVGTMGANDVLGSFNFEENPVDHISINFLKNGRILLNSFLGHIGTKRIRRNRPTANFLMMTLIVSMQEIVSSSGVDFFKNVFYDIVPRQSSNGDKDIVPHSLNPSASFHPKHIMGTRDMRNYPRFGEILHDKCSNEKQRQNK